MKLQPLEVHNASHWVNVISIGGFLYGIKVVCRQAAILNKLVLFLSHVACTSAVRSLARHAVDPPIEML